MEPTERPVLRSRMWLVAAVAPVVLVLVLATVGMDQPAAALTAVLVAAGVTVSVLGWSLVRSRRQRSAYEDDLTAWAAERAAQAERLRIARELHDLASHGLGLITVRAAAARALSGPAGDSERIQALTDIEGAGRAATTELRRMLTVLRGPGEEGAALRPPATLQDLPGVVDVARVSGVAATLDTHEVGDVSAGTQLTVCAIVREALANTARHAGPVSARVTVRRDGDAIVATVDDDGPAPGWLPHPGTGQGLAGLQERVAVLGGTLRVERAVDGFHLTARLPDGRRR